MATISGTGTVIGTDYDDFIFGGIKDNEIFGLGGNDIIAGGNSKDIIHGGKGNDWLDGGRADDELYGGMHNDTLVGGEGADFLDGGEGMDTAAYLTSDSGVIVSLKDGKGYEGDAKGDTLVSIENLTGSHHSDVLIGNDKGNMLNGLSGKDTILAGHGDDIINGGDDNDMLFGAGGKDRMIGGGGTDEIWGGADSDIFVLGDAGAGPNLDYVMDFVLGEDLIESSFLQQDVQVYDTYDAQHGAGAAIAVNGTTTMFVANVDADDVWNHGIDFI